MQDLTPFLVVVLVGTPAERERLRRTFVSAGIEVAGEAATLAAARAAHPEADAFVVAPGRDLAARRDEPIAVATEPLTPRERDVLRLLALGLPNKSIAERLGISDQTVKFHVASIIAKLGAANRTDVVRRAIRQGIIDV